MEEIGSWMLWMEGKRYNLWWSGNDYGVGCVGAMAMEELCEKVVEVRSVGNSMMAIVLVFDNVLKLIYWYALQNKK